MNFHKILSEGLDDTIGDLKNMHNAAQSGQPTTPPMAQPQQKSPVMPPTKPFAYELLNNGKSVFKTSEKFKLIDFINKLP